MRTRGADPAEPPDIRFHYFSEGTPGWEQALRGVVDGMEIARDVIAHAAELIPGLSIAGAVYLIGGKAIEVLLAEYAAPESRNPGVPEPQGLMGRPAGRPDVRCRWSTWQDARGRTNDLCAGRKAFPRVTSMPFAGLLVGPRRPWKDR
ncbi:hypothetical protein OIB37_01855 [Streptomyces sp. NBC_00820]|uniref:hypothetical protein n=1 Tax=Streptomyces sp. NBC_00820 TaxID=2975842 RepID=UPI002ED340C7|nr:hypothetical protein OIB37_01855 [Streptomyces sp. NBC_00820]